MNLVDVHCHLTFPQFREDLDSVIRRAKDAGVNLIICSGVGPKSNREVLALSKKYSHIIKPSFGIYPVDAVASMLPESEKKDDVPRDLEVFDYRDELTWITQNKDDCIAIGEVGLDYMMVKDEVARAKQREIFEEIIDVAKELGKPLVIHSRKGEGDVLDILESKNFKKADLHCFTANKKLIKRGVQLGLFFSVPAVITRLEHFKMLVELVPLTQLLTETDAPYLSPEAGGRSEPAHIASTIKIISKIKGLSENEVAAQVWKNTQELFGVK